MKSLKISKKTFLFEPQASSRQLPKQYIARLNANITNVQQSVNIFNEAEQRSIKWKKELNLLGNTCPLKALTQPKYQDLLLAGNWNDKESFLFRDKGKEKQGKNSSGVRKSIVRRNTMYSGASSVYAMKKTLSMGNETIRKTQQSPLKQSRAVQNPQATSRITQIPAKFNSFWQQIPHYNKPALISHTYHQNYSQANPSPKPISTTHPNQTFNNPTAKFSYHHAVANESGVSVIGEESKSVLMQSSLRLNNNEHNWFNDQKQLQLMPISEEKVICVGNQRNSRNLRNKITQKTIQLQKQWLKTQSYRQKFNIISCELTPPKDRKKNKTRTSISKLAHIIQKVSDRRPMTSQDKSRSVRTADQAIRSHNAQHNVNSHKARVNSSPNDQFHKNLFEFDNFPHD